MKKSDLKNGMVVRTRNCNLYIVLNNSLISKRGYMNLNFYTEDLKDGDCKGSYDIVAIYKEKKGHCLTPENWFINLGEPIWTREEEIDWSKVKPFTKVQVRDFENDEWGNRYFIGFAGEESFPFIVTHCDKFTYEPIENEKFKYCRLYKEENI